jgi:hypothetical protein
MRFVVDSAGRTVLYSQQWYSEVRRLPQLDVLLPDSHELLSSHDSGVAEKKAVIGHLAQEEGRGEAEDEEEGASQQTLQSATALNMSFRCMVEAREQLEKDLAGVVTNP